MADNATLDFTPFKALSDYEFFQNLVEEYFKENKIPIERDGYTIKARTINHEFNTSSLAYSVCKAPREEWKRPIYAFFDKTIQNPVNKERTIEEAKPLLRLRLFPEEQVKPISFGCVSEQLTANMRLVVMLDEGDRFDSVPITDLDKWGITASTCIDLAKKNHTDIKYILQKIIIQEEPNYTIARFSDNDGNGSAGIVSPVVKEFMEAENGSIVSLPEITSLLVYPVHSTTVNSMIRYMVGITIHFHRTNPKRLSEHIFYYSKGALEDIPYILKDGKVHIFPGPKFQAYLDNTPNKDIAN